MNTETADRSGEPASRPFVSQRGERNETNHDTSRGRRADTRCAGALPRADPAQKRRSVVMAHDDVNPDAPKKRLVITLDKQDNVLGWDKEWKELVSDKKMKEKEDEEDADEAD